MSASLSPDQHGSVQSQSSPEGSGAGLNLGFFKSLTEKRTARGGNPPKRRGPKPDSKPALTRKQELNRQAQRTHRERKELYVKALEDEVLRLKELYSNISKSKEKLMEENQQLKAILLQNGLQPRRSNDQDDGASPGAPGTSPGNGQGNGNGSGPGSYATFSPGAQSNSSVGQGMGLQPMSGQQMRSAPQTTGKQSVDFEQAGIDFVLTLEKPCMQHLPFLTDRASGEDGEACGHALMASCPPAPFARMTPDRPFGAARTHEQGDKTNPGQGTWNISKADLSTLLNLSQKLDLDGEITPVMAWGMILKHPHFADFGPEDFAKLAAELGRKVRCYGFGAVMEEFELRDACENVKPMGSPEVMVF